MPDDYTPDPFKNYTMKGNNTPKHIPAEALITEEVLNRLDNMDAEALKQLIRRVSGAMWGVGLKTREQREEALLLKLITFALTRDDAKEVVALAKEYFDRARGKPPQSVDINAKIGIVAIVLEAAKRGSNAILVDNNSLSNAAIQRTEPS